MPRRKSPSLHAAQALTAGLIALALLALSSPARAADADYKGWYGNLDLAFSQPNSLDQVFANHSQGSGTGTAQNERLSIDNDDSLTYRLDVGYSWGKKGRLQVSYWQFDNDDSQSDTLNGGVYPTIFGYGTYGAQYIFNPSGVDFEATSSIKASTWDVDFIRPMRAGETLTIHWLAGLRVAQYEEDLEFEGFDGVYTYTQDKHIESDAVGFRVGATMAFNFTKRFGVEAGAAFSFLQGSNEGIAHQSCPAGSSCDAGGVASRESNEAESDSVRGDIQDYHIRAVWNAGPVEWYVGYGMSAWGGMVEDPVPAIISGVGGSPPGTRNSISFNGFDVGVRWRFGELWAK